VYAVGARRTALVFERLEFPNREIDTPGPWDLGSGAADKSDNGRDRQINLNSLFCIGHRRDQLRIVIKMCAAAWPAR